MTSNPLRDWMAANPHQGFKPLPFYSRIGDTLHWHWDDARCYADPIDHDGLEIGCVMRCVKTSEPVGVKVYGVRGMVGPKHGEWARGFLAGFAAAASIGVVWIGSIVVWTVLR